MAVIVEDAFLTTVKSEFGEIGLLRFKQIAADQEGDVSPVFLVEMLSQEFAALTTSRPLRNLMKEKGIDEASLAVK